MCQRRAIDKHAFKGTMKILTRNRRRFPKKGMKETGCEPVGKKPGKTRVAPPAIDDLCVAYYRAIGVCDLMPINPSRLQLFS